MNSIKLLGRITNDLKIETKKAGEKDFILCRFGLAVKRNFGDNTDFINCIVYGKPAESLVKFSKKGNRLLVDGRLQIDTVKSEETTKSYTNVIVNNFYFVDYNTDSKKENSEVDELPFN